jgi:hypothetical protein
MTNFFAPLTIVVPVFLVMIAPALWKISFCMLLLVFWGQHSLGAYQLKQDKSNAQMMAAQQGGQTFVVDSPSEG